MQTQPYNTMIPDTSFSAKKSVALDDILHEMNQTRKQFFDAAEPTPEQRDAYLAQISKLADIVLTDESTDPRQITRALAPLVERITNDGKALMYDPVQDPHWNETDPAFTTQLEAASLLVLKDSYVEPSARMHILNLAKFLRATNHKSFGQVPADKEEKDKIFSSIQPFNGAAEHGLAGRLNKIAYHATNKEKNVAHTYTRTALTFEAPGKAIPEIIAEAYKRGFLDVDFDIRKKDLKLLESVRGEMTTTAIPKNHNKTGNKVLGYAINALAPITYTVLGSFPIKHQTRLEKLTAGKYHGGGAVVTSIFGTGVGGLVMGIAGITTANPVLAYVGGSLMVTSIYRFAHAVNTKHNENTLAGDLGKLEMLPITLTVEPILNAIDKREKMHAKISLRDLHKDGWVARGDYSDIVNRLSDPLPEAVLKSIEIRPDNRFNYGTRAMEYIKEGLSGLVEEPRDPDQGFVSARQEIELGSLRRVTYVHVTKDNSYVATIVVPASGNAGKPSTPTKQSPDQTAPYAKIFQSYTTTEALALELARATGAIHVKVIDARDKSSESSFMRALDGYVPE